MSSVFGKAVTGRNPAIEFVQEGKLKGGLCSYRFLLANIGSLKTGCTFFVCFLIKQHFFPVTGSGGLEFFP